jgi:hypothetical protein
MISKIEIFMSIIIIYCFVCTTKLHNIVINLFKRGTFRLLWLFFVSFLINKDKKEFAIMLTLGYLLTMNNFTLYKSSKYEENFNKLKILKDKIENDLKKIDISKLDKKLKLDEKVLDEKVLDEKELDEKELDEKELDEEEIDELEDIEQSPV